MDRFVKIKKLRNYLIYGIVLVLFLVLVLNIPVYYFKENNFLIDALGIIIYFVYILVSTLIFLFVSIFLLYVAYFFMFLFFLIISIFTRDIKIIKNNKSYNGH